MIFGALQQYILSQLGLQWTLCIEALILSTGILCSILLIPAPMHDEFSMQDNHTTENDNSSEKSCNSGISNIFHCTLFTDPSYILFCSGLFLMVFGYYIPQIYLPEYAISRGSTHQQSANLISVIGFTNLFSRLLFGILGDRGPRLRIWLCGGSLILLGIINVALTFFKMYWVFLVYASLFGISIGCFISLFSVILVDLFGLEILEKSLGQAMATNSPVFLFGTPLIGFLVDRCHSIHIPFYVPGVASILGGFLFLSILCIHDFTRQKYEKISS